MDDVNAGNGFPRFGYHLASSRHADFGWIVADRNRYHKIGDVTAFYRALGYRDGLREADESPGEFLWRRYTCERPQFSLECLQVQIRNYLYGESGKFRQDHGQLFNLHIGKCVSDAIDGHDNHCVQCSMHPRFSYEKYDHQDC